MTPPLPDPKPLTTSELLRSTVWTLLTLLAVYALVYFLFEEQIHHFGVWFGERFGLSGVFAFCFLVDFLILPVSIDLLFPVAIQQGWEAIPLLFVMATGSIFGGYTGFLVGRYLDHIPFIRNMTAGYEARGRDIITRWGFWAVVAAALTPIPYSTVSWIAGMLRLKHSTYLLASLARFPRVALYYLLIKGTFFLVPGTAG